MNPTIESIVSDTIRWLENIVIGLNLCPFAKAIHVKNQIRFHVSSARDAESLLNELRSELKCLADADAESIESTLLIHPYALTDFADYNAFLADCDQAVTDLDLEGIFQIASFHPDYQFAGTREDAVTNYTNRSPYPMLHLLREESVTRAVESFPDIDGIYKKNMALLKKIGTAGMIAILKKEQST